MQISIQSDTSEGLVFVNEVDFNISQAKDGNVGGQTYLCTKDDCPQNWAATKDACLTLLGLQQMGSPSCAQAFLLPNH
jgi:hypothetical protein